MLSFFFHFYANGQPNVTYGIHYLSYCHRSPSLNKVFHFTSLHYYITTEFDYAKHDSGLVLQRFEFIKVFMRMQRLCLKSQLFLYFVNKIYLPCYCVVFFVVCRLLRPI